MINIVLLITSFLIVGFMIFIILLQYMIGRNDKVADTLKKMLDEGYTMSQIKNYQDILYSFKKINYKNCTK